MKFEGLLVESIVWLLVWRRLSVFMLLGMVIASALGVSLAAHQTRKSYTALNMIRQESDALDSEYEKLLLEQSAWADFSRVDQISRKELGMKPPGPKNMVIVKR